MTELADRFEFVVRWEPFLLRPDTPAQGTPKPANFADPTPGANRLKQAGLAVGVDFSFKCPTVPNTLKAHALMEYAKNQDSDGQKQNQVAELLFKTYFTDGKVLDEPVLMDISGQVGLDVNEVKPYISDTNRIKSIYEKAASWRGKGVSGVPFFYINGQQMFSGAQDPDVFKKMFSVAAEKFPQSRN